MVEDIQIFNCEVEGEIFKTDERLRVHCEVAFCKSMENHKLHSFNSKIVVIVYGLQLLLLMNPHLL